MQKNKIDIMKIKTKKSVCLKTFLPIINLHSKYHFIISRSGDEYTTD